MPTPQEPPAVSPETSPLVRRLATAGHIDLRAVHGTGPGGRITRADVQHAAAEHPATEQMPAEPVTPPRRQRISPLARRLAAELGVDLTAIAGTGPHGVIGADDVRRAASAQPPAPVTARQEAHAETMRAAIATLMSRANREIPHYYLTETVDLAAMIAWLHERNRALPVHQRLVPAAPLLKAAARAARAVPDLNGFWLEDRYVPADAVHLGVAVSLRDGGLIAPAIHNAADLDLTELMAQLKDLVTRARSGRLRHTELSDPTITVSNMGEQGAESILGVIYPPQVALVGFGRITDRPWAVGGLIGIRPIVVASIAADHRATDGATGARYLHTLAQLLQTPEQL